MTCIAALLEKGRVWMAADSAATDGQNFSLSSRADLKMFKLSGEMLVGCAGSFRVRDLVRYKMPSFRFDPTKDEPSQFIVTDFVEALRQVLKDGGACANNDGRDSFDGEILVAFRGKLFLVYSDFQVEERPDGYSAAGLGSDLAQGSLFTTEGLKLSPRKRLERALLAAEKFNASVRAPFHFMSL